MQSLQRRTDQTKAAGVYPDFTAAAARMTGTKRKVFEQDRGRHETYGRLFALYKELHDAFGRAEWKGRLAHVMMKGY